MKETGRFAPSPTGPLHKGSLLAAVGSWLFARAAGGRWLVRMEDLDSPRVVSGAAEEILNALRRYGLEWDGEVEYQSRRLPLYEAAVGRLRSGGFAFDCCCSRAELARAASAPLGAEPVYPGTCRNGLPAGREARAVRFRAPSETVGFDDLVCGRIEEQLDTATGDFVIKRADGVFAYQLAVVVDDAEQGVTQVVRGADLLRSTPRQIALQRALGFQTPRYAHLPLLLGPDGRKLGKRDGALPLDVLNDEVVADTLRETLGTLGISVEAAGTSKMLRDALALFDPRKIPRAENAVVT